MTLTGAAERSRIARTQHHPIGTAVIPNGDGTFDLVNSHGDPLLTRESWQVCSNVQDALDYPDRWAPTEAYEMADSIRRAQVAA